MAPDFKGILVLGGERAVADIAVRAVEDDPASIRDLLDLCFLEKYPLSMRASRALQLYCELHPGDIYPYLDETIEKALRSKIPGVRRNFLKIYAEFIDLDRLADPGPLVNTCFEWLMDMGLPPGIRIHAMGVIYKIGLKEPGLHHELEETIKMMMEQAEPSFQSCGKKLLAKISRQSVVSSQQ